MTRLLALCALLGGCPAVLPQSETKYADCCEPTDAGEPCKWVAVGYRITRYAEAFASDELACRNSGLEPYRKDQETDQ